MDQNKTISSHTLHSAIITYYHPTTIMIAAIHHSSTRNAVKATVIGKNGATFETTADWSVKDRVALFERQTALYAGSTSTCKTHKPQHTSIVDGDSSNVDRFLESMGEDSPQATLPPRLRRLACEWKKNVQERTNQRQNDDSFYFLSEEFNHLDAILYSDTASLEMDALDLLSCSTTTRRDEAAYALDDFDDDGSVEEEELHRDTSIRLLALESGLDELAKELHHFKRVE